MTELPGLNELRNKEKDTLIRALWAQVQALTTQIQALLARVAELEAKLGGLSKTLENPSLPPSQGREPNQVEKAPRPGPRPDSQGHIGGWTAVG